MTDESGEAAQPPRFGDFVLLELLRADETGQTYTAEDPATGQRVELRVLSRLYTCDEAAIEAVVRGLKTLPELRHECIGGAPPHGEPQVVGTAVGVPMEASNGQPLLREIQQTDGLSWLEVASVGVDLCRALAHAHARGVVHGDVRPEHCTRVGASVKLAGFGLAAAYRRSLAAASAAYREDAEETPEYSVYLAPEQIEGREPDVRSDIYALGVLMIHALTGSRPRARGWPPAVEGFERRPSTLPPALERVVLQAIARAPAERHGSATALLEAILAAPAQEYAKSFVPPPRRPSPSALEVVYAVGMTLLALWLFFG